MKLLIINGPNLNLLGTREPGIYGTVDYAGLCEIVKKEAEQLQIEVEFYQSNVEGELVNAIHGAKGTMDGIIINPGAYTHYSYAILDALSAVQIPTVEVHISNVHKREPFRHTSVTAPACVGQITGLGIYGYVAAMKFFAQQGV